MDIIQECFYLVMYAQYRFHYNQVHLS